MEIVYFETSAVNYLARRLDIRDAIATRPYQELRGRAWVISPVVIWEIFLNSSEVRREKLIAFCQRLFHRELLPSPEELLIQYIERGCPEAENPRSLKSEGEMAAVWRELCEVPDKTFVFDKGQAKAKATAVNSLVRDLHRSARGQDVSLIRYDQRGTIEFSLEEALWLMPSVVANPNIDHNERTLYKIGIFYVLVLLCAQIGPDPAPVIEFWRRVGVEGTADRLKYLLSHHESCVTRGPISGMAHMTKMQCAEKYSRGAYFDSLHTTYLPCVSVFMTEDQDFVQLRDTLGWHVNSRKIIRPSEMKWTFESRAIPTDTSVIRT